MLGRRFRLGGRLLGKGLDEAELIPQALADQILVATRDPEEGFMGSRGGSLAAHQLTRQRGCLGARTDAGSQTEADTSEGTGMTLSWLPIAAGATATRGGCGRETGSFGPRATVICRSGRRIDRVVRSKAHRERLATVKRLKVDRQRGKL